MPTPSRSAPELTVHEGGAGAPTPEPGPERGPGAEKAPEVTPPPAEFRTAGARWLEDEAYARAVLAYGAAFAVTTFAVLTVWFNVLGGGEQPAGHTTAAHPAAEPAPPPVVVAEVPPAPVEPAAAPEPLAAEPIATPPPAPTPAPVAATTPPTAAKPPAPPPSKPATATAPATTPSKPATATSKPATTPSKPATTTSAAAAPTTPPAATTPPPAAETPPPATTTAAAAAAPASLTGTYLGKTMGRTLALDLDFKPGGQLGGTIRLHDGTTAIAVPASGTYSIGSDGTVTLSLTETGVSEPAVYSGTMIGKAIDGRVTVAGRSRGKFTAKR